MYLLVLVIRLFAFLIGGLITACIRMVISGAQLVGVLIQDDQRVRAQPGPNPGDRMPAGEKVMAGFFILMFGLIAFAMIASR
jgi:hypothetical protein